MRFGIMACPECNRVIWWLLRSEGTQPIFSSRSKDGSDFLDVVELVMAMEKEFGMEIPDEDAKKFQSVEDVIDYFEKHRKQK